MNAHFVLGRAFPKSQWPGGPGGRGKRDLDRILVRRKLPARARATKAPSALSSNDKSIIGRVV